MSHQILTTDELKALTNATQKRKQCEVLDKAGIRYVEGPGGEPATTWVAVNSVLAANEANHKEQFNFEALKRLERK